LPSRILGTREPGTNNTSRPEKPTLPEDRKVDSNLIRFHGEAASSAVEDAAVNYQSPSIIAAGADAQSVSVLTTLINLSLSLICLKAPAFIERLGLTRKGAVALAFLNLCSWVPLILAFLLTRLGITPGWFALLWLVNLMPALLLSVQRDNWLSNLVPRGTLGRYLGQRLAIRSAFYLGSFYLLGYLLDAFKGETSVGFVVIFTIAFLAAFVDFLIFTFMHETKVEAVNVPRQKPEPMRFGLFDYLGELKEKKLDTFITFTSLFYLTVGLSGPLYAVYMLQELHLSYLSFTMILSAEYLARIVSVPFWGRLADRVGNIRVLGIVSRVIPLIPICWLFGSNISYLAFVQVLSGVCWGAYDLSTQSYLYKVAPLTLPP
jgi:MFS family permease